LYYVLAAWLETLFGASFGPGRALSLASGATAAVLVGWLAQRRTQDVRAGVFAAALFLALGFPGEYPWFGFYKEDVLGVALCLASIATLSAGASRRHIVAAAVLASLALLTKQTLIGAAFAGTVVLARRSRADALLFAGVAFGLTGAAALFLEATTHAFFANTVVANVNPFDGLILLWSLELLFAYQAGPLLLTALWLGFNIARRRPVLDDPVAVYALICVPTLIGLAKIGSSYNYWIDLAAVSAVLATGAIWQAIRAAKNQQSWIRSAAPLCAIAILGIHVGAWFEWAQPSLALRSILPEQAQRSVRHTEQFAWVVERARSAPGAVLSESVDVLALAGRPMIVEPYITTIMYDAGRWDLTPLVREICAGKVGLLIVKGPLETGNGYNDYIRSAMWPKPVLEALRETMILETVKADLFVYGQPELAHPAGPVCSASS
jgi:hypothetical protein